MNSELQKKMVVRLNEYIDTSDRNKTIEQLGIDSLKKMELVFFIEDEFGITLSDEKLDSIKTVGDLLDVMGLLSCE